MSPYAAKTGVGVDRTKSDIERLLQRYSADQFAYGWDSEAAMVQFRMMGRLVRLKLPMLDPRDREFTLTPTGRDRSEIQAAQAYEQDVRRRWRALLLIIKAKLEAVESGISVFEEEFLAYTVLPDNRTVGEFMGPQVELAYKTGQLPHALPALSAGSKERS